MRIVVHYAETSYPDLRAWLARLPGSLEDRRRLVDNAIQALNEELVRTTGHPTGVEYREEPAPARYWWHFTGDCWVSYTISDSRSMFKRTRTIEVMGFHEALPS
jgi:hypothetical protein